MRQVASEQLPDGAIVSASGEVDAFVAPDLRRALDQRRPDRVLVVDLTRVTFMDSTALGVVVRTVRERGEAGRDVRVVLPAGNARRIFEITTLDRVLPLARDVESALAELRSAGAETR
jgi:anti-sigma B factor antagonist